jgi:hypothetical protein
MRARVRVALHGEACELQRTIVLAAIEVRIRETRRRCRARATLLERAMERRERSIAITPTQRASTVAHEIA